MKIKHGKYEFSKLIGWIVGSLVLIVFLNFAASFLGIYMVSTQAKDAGDEMIRSGVEELNRILSTAEQALAGELSYDTDITRLSVAGGALNLDYLETYSIVTRLKEILESWRNQRDFMLHYVIWIPDTDTTITSCSISDDYLQWYEIEDDLKTYITEQTKTDPYVTGGPWKIVKMEGENFLVNCYRMEGRYMASYIPVESLLSSDLFENGNDSEEYFIFLDQDMEPVNNRAFVEKENIDFSQIEYDQRKLELFNGRIVAKAQLLNAEFSIGIIVDGYPAIISVLGIQTIIGVLLLLAGFAYIWLVFYIRKTVIKPIQTFSDNLEKLEQDENYAVATHYQINELGKASELLADMVGKIKGLKINIYEKTLEEQKIQMDFLSLQIEPHFYLNCLNIIYNLAELEKYREIQTLSRCVSDYLRYIFKHHNDMVRFGDELGHIRKYLEIQKIRYRNGFDMKIDVDDEVLGAVVPPLFIQTFVENSIKHTVDWDEEIRIHLQAGICRGDDGEMYVEVRIEDTGEGFEAEILDKLQHGGDISQGERRIGIMNAVRRLRLAYKDRAVIRFYNCMPHGAGVYIRLPYEKIQKGE